MIRPYLRDMINDHKTRRIWKVHSGNKVIDYKTQSERKFQLTIWINFMSSKDSDEIRTMRTKSYNVDIIKERFKSLFQKYQEELEESMRGSEFVFDSIDLLYTFIKQV